MREDQLTGRESGQCDYSQSIYKKTPGYGCRLSDAGAVGPVSCRPGCTSAQKRQVSCPVGGCDWNAIHGPGSMSESILTLHSWMRWRNELRNISQIIPPKLCGDCVRRFHEQSFLQSTLLFRLLCKGNDMLFTSLSWTKTLLLKVAILSILLISRAIWGTKKPRKRKSRSRFHLPVLSSLGTMKLKGKRCDEFRKYCERV